jgi:hypothetical protein
VLRFLKKELKDQALQVYDDHCGQKYIMTLNHDMKKVETFKEGEKWLQMI